MGLNHSFAASVLPAGNEIPCGGNRQCGLAKALQKPNSAEVSLCTRQAHAPPFAHLHSAIPILRALSARFSTISGPENTITPTGRASNIASLRRHQRRVLVPGPVWLEGDLRDLPILGLASGDALGSLETDAVERNHVGMPVASPLVRRPDAGAVVAISACRASNAGTGRQRNLGPGKVAGVQKIPLSMSLAVSARHLNLTPLHPFRLGEIQRRR